MDKTETPDSGRGLYGSTPFGGDKENTTHVQPAAPTPSKTLPGEQEDPRFC